jgi:hypothetical protein
MRDKDIKEYNENFIALVESEARKLKEFSNNEEKEILEDNRDNLCSSSAYSCIYGLMTGNCFSDRATSLIDKCNENLLNGLYNDARLVNNGVYRKETMQRVFNLEEIRSERRGFTPIENFINLFENNKRGKNKELIDFLVGKTDKLDLKL